MKKILVSIALLAVASVSAMAQVGSATAYQSASATVTSTISLSNYQDLNFGSLSTNGYDATVTGSIYNGFSSDYATLLGGYQYGMMYVSGTQGANYYISLPSYAYLSNANGYSMLVDNFTSYANYSGSSNNHSNLAYGYEYLYIGASLHVAANQPAGTYTGSYAVTVSYE